MLRIIVCMLCLCFFFAPITRAQDVTKELPEATVITHFHLPVSYNTTTVLIFPAAVRPVDRGDRDIIAQKQPGVENVLKVKAARKAFTETNLHVFTADGKVFAFDVTYTDSLSATYDLSRLTTPVGPIPDSTVVFFSDQPVNSAQMEDYIHRLSSLPPRHTETTRTSEMVLRLDRIGLASNLLLFRLTLSNKSNLDYSLDFVRLYIRDRERVKRSSIQERELYPIYEDSLKTVPGNSSATHFLALPAFTLPQGKEFLIEAYEKNGGRLLTLRLRNKPLLRAVKL